MIKTTRQVPSKRATTRPGRSLATLVAALCVLLLGLGDAWAGIIITEGDVPTSPSEKVGVGTKKAKKTGRRGTPGGSSDGDSDDKSPPPMTKGGKAPSDPVPKDGDLPIGGDGSDVETFLADLDAPVPDGYECEDVGGGVQLCTKVEQATAKGAGPGAAGGGGLAADAAFDDSASAPGTGGCQGGGSGSSSVLWLALMALALATRRRLGPA